MIRRALVTVALLLTAVGAWWLWPASPDPLLVGPLTIRVPGGAGPIFLGGAFVVALTIAGALRRASRSHHAATPTTSGRSGGRRVRAAVITVTACGGAASLALGALAWTLPANRSRTETVGYEQSASISYAATTDPGPAYAHGRLSTGDPVFLALVSAVDVTVSYRVTTKATHALGGTRAVQAVLSTGNGWIRRITLVAPGRFEGDSFEVRAPLDLAQFPQLVHEVESTTRVPIHGYTLTVQADVVLAGSVAQQPVRQTLRPTLTFAMDDRQLRLTPGRGAGRTPGRPVVTKAPGAVRRSQLSPTTVNVLGHRVPPSSLRGWASALGALLLLCAAGASVGLPRRRPRYQPNLLHAEPVDPVPGRTVVDLDSMESLVRVAERYERFILHSAADDEHRFVVDDGSAMYRYHAREEQPSGGVATLLDAPYTPQPTATGAVTIVPKPSATHPTPYTPGHANLPGPRRPADPASAVQSFVDSLRRH